ncbi:hypothetical protein M011DRAFT_506122 [Sporormia fimetaria CBS 119925]|uniref:Uncharacterized protein n=1 Tax=Sporormia fimetaria CBS 119925 TaxID=1340428 RepID=A0A6A6V646_9PLEO|nr:hypothetical protein M011DRAFT_506122 [Sporormia fimetaria CBS 119925]
MCSAVSQCSVPLSSLSSDDHDYDGSGTYVSHLPVALSWTRMASYFPPGSRDVAPRDVMHFDHNVVFPTLTIHRHRRRSGTAGDHVPYIDFHEEYLWSSMGHVCLAGRPNIRGFRVRFEDAAHKPLALFEEFYDLDRESAIVGEPRVHREVAAQVRRWLDKQWGRDRVEKLEVEKQIIRRIKGKHGSISKSLIIPRAYCVIEIAQELVPGWNFHVLRGKDDDDLFLASLVAEKPLTKYRWAKLQDRVREEDVVESVEGDEAGEQKTETLRIESYDTDAEGDEVIFTARIYTEESQKSWVDASKVLLTRLKQLRTTRRIVDVEEELMKD